VSNQRRTIIRPRRPASSNGQQSQKQQRTLAKLNKATAALNRWQKRLVRACNAVIKHQKQIARLQRQLNETNS
jgi:hypothetical protein